MTPIPYMLFIFALTITGNSALEEINTAITLKAAEDNPVLLKILQTVDEATSNEQLFDVTLNLLKSLCVCMRETLRTKQSENFQLSRAMKSLQTEDDVRESNRKVLDIYQNIYNKTCFDLREELAMKVNKSGNFSPEEEGNFMSHSNSGKKAIDENTEDYEMSQIVERKSNLKKILRTTFVTTRNYHKFHMRKFNLFTNSQKSTQNSIKHSIIVILTFYPHQNGTHLSENFTEVSSAELNTTLYSQSPIDIDVIDTRYGRKENSRDEDIIPKPATDCSLKSIYSFLLQSEQVNKTKVFKMLRKKSTIKVYIDVPTQINHIDYSKVCCSNKTEIPLCKVDFSRESFDSHEVTTYLPEFKKRKKLHGDYKDTISKIKTLVKLYDKKLSGNKLNQLDLITNKRKTKSKFNNIMTYVGKNPLVADEDKDDNFISSKDKYFKLPFRSKFNYSYPVAESTTVKKYFNKQLVTEKYILLNTNSSNASYAAEKTFRELKNNEFKTKTEIQSTKNIMATEILAAGLSCSTNADDLTETFSDSANINNNTIDRLDPFKMVKITEKYPKRHNRNTVKPNVKSKINYQISSTLKVTRNINKKINNFVVINATTTDENANNKNYKVTSERQIEKEIGAPTSIISNDNLPNPLLISSDKYFNKQQFEASTLPNLSNMKTVTTSLKTFFDINLMRENSITSSVHHNVDSDLKQMVTSDQINSQLTELKGSMLNKMNFPVNRDQLFHNTAKPYIPIIVIDNDIEKKSIFTKRPDEIKITKNLEMTEQYGNIFDSFDSTHEIITAGTNFHLLQPELKNNTLENYQENDGLNATDILSKITKKSTVNNFPAGDNITNVLGSTYFDETYVTEKIRGRTRTIQEINNNLKKSKLFYKKNENQIERNTFETFLDGNRNPNNTEHDINTIKIFNSPKQGYKNKVDFKIKDSGKVTINSELEVPDWAEINNLKITNDGLQVKESSKYFSVSQVHKTNNLMTELYKTENENSKINDNSKEITETLHTIERNVVSNYDKAISKLNYSGSTTSSITTTCKQPHGNIDPLTIMGDFKSSKDFSNFFADAEYNIKRDNNNALKSTILSNKEQLLISQALTNPPEVTYFSKDITTLSAKILPESGKNDSSMELRQKVKSDSLFKTTKLNDSTKRPTEIVATNNIGIGQRELNMPLSDIEQYSSKANKSRITRSTSAMKNPIGTYNQVSTLSTTVPFSDNSVINVSTSAVQDLDKSTSTKAFRSPEIGKNFEITLEKTKSLFSATVNPNLDKIQTEVNMTPRAEKYQSMSENDQKITTYIISPNVIQDTDTKKSIAELNNFTDFEALNKTSDERYDAKKLYNIVKATILQDQAYIEKPQNFIVTELQPTKSINIIETTYLKTDKNSDEHTKIRESVASRLSTYLQQGKTYNTPFDVNLKEKNVGKDRELAKTNYDHEIRSTVAHKYAGVSMEPRFEEAFETQLIQSLQMLNFSDSQNNSKLSLSERTENGVDSEASSSLEDINNDFKNILNFLNEPSHTNQQYTTKAYNIIISDTKAKNIDKSTIIQQQPVPLKVFAENVPGNITISGNQQVNKKNTILSKENTKSINRHNLSTVTELVDDLHTLTDSTEKLLKISEQSTFQATRTDASLKIARPNKFYVDYLTQPITPISTLVSVSSSNGEQKYKLISPEDKDSDIEQDLSNAKTSSFGDYLKDTTPNFIKREHTKGISRDRDVSFEYMKLNIPHTSRLEGTKKYIHSVTKPQMAFKPELENIHEIKPFKPIKYSKIINRTKLMGPNRDFSSFHIVDSLGLNKEKTRGSERDSKVDSIINIASTKYIGEAHNVAIITPKPYNYVTLKMINPSRLQDMLDTNSNMVHNILSTKKFNFTRDKTAFSTLSGRSVSDFPSSTKDNFISNVLEASTILNHQYTGKINESEATKESPRSIKYFTLMQNTHNTTSYDLATQLYDSIRMEKQEKNNEVRTPPDITFDNMAENEISKDLLNDLLKTNFNKVESIYGLEATQKAKNILEITKEPSLHEIQKSNIIHKQLVTLTKKSDFPQVTESSSSTVDKLDEASNIPRTSNTLKQYTVKPNDFADTKTRYANTTAIADLISLKNDRFRAFYKSVINKTHNNSSLKDFLNTDTNKNYALKHLLPTKLFKNKKTNSKIDDRKGEIIKHSKSKWHATTTGNNLRTKKYASSKIKTDLKTHNQTPNYLEVPDTLSYTEGNLEEDEIIANLQKSSIILDQHQADVLDDLALIEPLSNSGEFHIEIDYANSTPSRDRAKTFIIMKDITDMHTILSPNDVTVGYLTENYLHETPYRELSVINTDRPETLNTFESTEFVNNIDTKSGIFNNHVDITEVPRFDTTLTGRVLRNKYYNLLKKEREIITPNESYFSTQKVENATYDKNRHGVNITRSNQVKTSHFSSPQYAGVFHNLEVNNLHTSKYQNKAQNTFKATLNDQVTSMTDKFSKSTKYNIFKNVLQITEAPSFKALLMDGILKTRYHTLFEKETEFTTQNEKQFSTKTTESSTYTKDRHGDNVALSNDVKTSQFSSPQYTVISHISKVDNLHSSEYQNGAPNTIESTLRDQDASMTEQLRNDKKSGIFSNHLKKTEAPSFDATITLRVPRTRNHEILEKETELTTLDERYFTQTAENSTDIKNNHGDIVTISSGKTSHYSSPQDAAISHNLKVEKLHSSEYQNETQNKIKTTLKDQEASMTDTLKKTAGTTVSYKIVDFNNETVGEYSKTETQKYITSKTDLTTDVYKSQTKSDLINERSNFDTRLDIVDVPLRITKESSFDEIKTEAIVKKLTSRKNKTSEFGRNNKYNNTEITTLRESVKVIKSNKSQDNYYDLKNKSKKETIIKHNFTDTQNSNKKLLNNKTFQYGDKFKSFEDIIESNKFTASHNKTLNGLAQNKTHEELFNPLSTTSFDRAKMHMNLEKAAVTDIVGDKPNVTHKYFIITAKPNFDIVKRTERHDTVTERLLNFTNTKYDNLNENEQVKRTSSTPKPLSSLKLNYRDKLYYAVTETLPDSDNNFTPSYSEILNDAAHNKRREKISDPSSILNETDIHQDLESAFVTNNIGIQPNISDDYFKITEKSNFDRIQAVSLAKNLRHEAYNSFPFVTESTTATKSLKYFANTKFMEMPFNFSTEQTLSLKENDDKRIFNTARTSSFLNPKYGDKVSHLVTEPLFDSLKHYDESTETIPSNNNFEFKKENTENPNIGKTNEIIFHNLAENGIYNTLSNMLHATELDKLETMKDLKPAKIFDTRFGITDAQITPTETPSLYETKKAEHVPESYNVFQYPRELTTSESVVMMGDSRNDLKTTILMEQSYNSQDNPNFSKVNFENNDTVAFVGETDKTPQVEHTDLTIRPFLNATQTVEFLSATEQNKTETPTVLTSDAITSSKDSIVNGFNSVIESDGSKYNDRSQKSGVLTSNDVNTPQDSTIIKESFELITDMLALIETATDSYSHFLDDLNFLDTTSIDIVNDVRPSNKNQTGLGFQLAIIADKTYDQNETTRKIDTSVLPLGKVIENESIKIKDNLAIITQPYVSKKSENSFKYSTETDLQTISTTPDLNVNTEKNVLSSKFNQTLNILLTTRVNEPSKMNELLDIGLTPKPSNSIEISKTGGDHPGHLYNSYLTTDKKIITQVNKNEDAKVASYDEAPDARHDDNFRLMRESIKYFEKKPTAVNGLEKSTKYGKKKNADENVIIATADKVMPEVNKTAIVSNEKIKELLYNIRSSFNKEFNYPNELGLNSEKYYFTGNTETKPHLIDDTKLSHETEPRNVFDGTKITQPTVLDHYPVTATDHTDQLQSKTSYVNWSTRQNEINLEVSSDTSTSYVSQINTFNINRNKTISQTKYTPSYLQGKKINQLNQYSNTLSPQKRIVANISQHSENLREQTVNEVVLTYTEHNSERHLQNPENRNEDVMEVESKSTTIAPRTTTMKFLLDEVFTKHKAKIKTRPEFTDQYFVTTNTIVPSVKVTHMETLEGTEYLKNEIISTTVTDSTNSFSTLSMTNDNIITNRNFKPNTVGEMKIPLGKNPAVDGGAMLFNVPPLAFHVTDLKLELVPTYSNDKPQIIPKLHGKFNISLNMETQHVANSMNHNDTLNVLSKAFADQLHPNKSFVNSIYRSRFQEPDSEMRNHIETAHDKKTGHYSPNLVKNKKFLSNNMSSVSKSQIVKYFSVKSDTLWDDSTNINSEIREKNNGIATPEIGKQTDLVQYTVTDIVQQENTSLLLQSNTNLNNHLSSSPLFDQNPTTDSYTLDTNVNEENILDDLYALNNNTLSDSIKQVELKYNGTYSGNLTKSAEKPFLFENTKTVLWNNLTQVQSRRYGDESKNFLPTPNKDVVKILENKLMDKNSSNNPGMIHSNTIVTKAESNSNKTNIDTTMKSFYSENAVLNMSSIVDGNELNSNFLPIKSTIVIGSLSESATSNQSKTSLLNALDKTNVPNPAGVKKGSIEPTANTSQLSESKSDMSNVMNKLNNNLVPIISKPFHDISRMEITEKSDFPDITPVYQNKALFVPKYKKTNEQNRADIKKGSTKITKNTSQLSEAKSDMTKSIDGKKLTSSFVPIILEPLNDVSTMTITEKEDLPKSTKPNQNKILFLYENNETNVQNLADIKKSSTLKPYSITPIVLDTVLFVNKINKKKNNSKYKNEKSKPNIIAKFAEKISTGKEHTSNTQGIELKSVVGKPSTSVSKSKNLPNIRKAYDAITLAELSTKRNINPGFTKQNTDMLTSVDINIVNTTVSHHVRIKDKNKYLTELGKHQNNRPKILEHMKVKKENSFGNKIAISGKTGHNLDQKVKYRTFSLHQPVHFTSTSLLRTTRQIKYNTYRPLSEEEIDPSELHKIISSFPNYNTKKVKTKNPQQVKNYHAPSGNKGKYDTKQDLHNKSIIFDPLDKKNIFPVKKMISNPRKIIKRLKLANKRNDIMTMNTQDFFSRRLGVTRKDKIDEIRKLYPKPVLKLRPVTTKPRVVILRPKFNSLNALKKKPAIQKPVIVQNMDIDYYRGLTPSHYRRSGPAWSTPVSKIPGKLKVHPRIGYGDPVIDSPYYIPTIMKPKFLRDRVNSIRSYIYNAETKPSYRRHFLNHPSDPEDADDSFVQYSKGNSRDEENINTPLHKFTRPKKTIFFLSPTVPYNRYF